MKKRVRKLWIDALRSNKYKQGKRKLLDVTKCESRHTKKTYCCLGVLCDLYHKEQEIKDTLQEWLNEEGENATLPCSVAKWAGVSNSPDVKLTKKAKKIIENTASYEDWGDSKRGSVEFIEANDLRELTFGEIADLIEFGGAIK